MTKLTDTQKVKLDSKYYKDDTGQYWLKEQKPEDYDKPEYCNEEKKYLICSICKKCY
jgi:hypothetical protein